MKNLKPLPIIIISVLILPTVVKAQNAKYYYAKVITVDGKKQGLLERVNDQFVCIATLNDYWAIPIKNIKSIKLKQYQGSTSDIIAGSIVESAGKFGKMWNNNQQAIKNGTSPYPDSKENAGSYYTAGAIVGLGSGAIKSLQKSIVFKINCDTSKFKEHENNLKQYAIRNQIEGDYILDKLE